MLAHICRLARIAEHVFVANRAFLVAVPHEQTCSRGDSRHDFRLALPMANDVQETC